MPKHSQQSNKQLTPTAHLSYQTGEERCGNAIIVVVSEVDFRVLHSIDRTSLAMQLTCKTAVI